MRTVFEDRADAGRQLGDALRKKALHDPVVFALPRGGVPVAAEVARALNAPLDLVLVRKIGAPGQPELAVAAVCDGAEPTLVIDDETLSACGASMAYVNREAPHHLAEIERRRRVYLKDRAPTDVEGKTVVLVDDGIATGTTVRAALESLRRRRPARLVLAVPVAPADEAARLREEVDDLVCLSTPVLFGAVGNHYRTFAQTSDEEVVEALEQSHGAR